MLFKISRYMGDKALLRDNSVTLLGYQFSQTGFVGFHYHLPIMKFWKGPSHTFKQSNEISTQLFQQGYS